MIIGIDAARWQGPLQSSSELVSAGLGFVITKATHGLGPLDPQFKHNWNVVGTEPLLLRGAYHWFTDTDPVAQAEHLVSSVTLQETDLPFALDFEEPSTIYRGQELVDRVSECVRRIIDLTNRPVIFYTGKWYIDQFVGKVDMGYICENTILWLAEYPRIEIRNRRACGIETPILTKPKLPWQWATRNLSETFWQFDGNGGCLLPNGVDADFNRFLGSVDELRAIASERIFKGPVFYPKPDVPNATDFVKGLAKS